MRGFQRRQRKEEQEEEEEEEWMMGFEPTAFRMASGSWARAYRPTKSHCERKARLSSPLERSAARPPNRGRAAADREPFLPPRSELEGRSQPWERDSGAEHARERATRRFSAQTTRNRPRPRLCPELRVQLGATTEEGKGRLRTIPPALSKGFHRLLRGASERLRRVEGPIGLREERIVERLRARGHADRHPERK
jgi:hypothetical protein